MTETKNVNGQEPNYQENLPAAIKTVGRALSAPNIAQRITNLLPATVTLDKFRSVMIHYLRQNPSLHNCNPDSLVMACIDCAESGLLPDRNFGQAYIVPFKGQAQFMLGYRGMIQLAMNSDRIDSIHAAVVMDTDEFEVYQGTELKIVHRPDMKIDRATAKPVAAYAIAFIKGARNPEFVVMSHSEVEAIRKRASSGNSPAWTGSQTNYNEMMRKTAIRRLFKTLPMSITDKAGKFAAMEDTFEETGKAVHFDLASTDYTVEEEPNDAAQPGQSGAATGPARGAGSDTEQTGGGHEPDRAAAPAKTGSAGPGKERPAAGPRGGEHGAGSKPAGDHSKPRQSARLKQALVESIARGEQDGNVTPHDPETGEIIEGNAAEVMEPTEGPDFSTEDEPDTGPVDFVLVGAKRSPDLGRWVVDVSNRLDRFSTPTQVQQFQTAVTGSRPWVYIKARSPETVKQFEELVEMRKEALA